MGLLSRLFKKEEDSPLALPAEPHHSSTDNQWKELPVFIEAVSEDYELVSVIATAIAAGTYENSQFIVKRILVRNPEAHIVSLVASSIAAGDTPDSQFYIKKIMKKDT